ncbi:glycoside hydrolase family 32 protein [Sinomonas sp. P47F7]|uniref:glycoside hydrolase family 32 protein n=1 Tax=Sinomonas sp. P47F7 TaxID=3410987 RepID=UPI003BF53E7A
MTQDQPAAPFAAEAYRPRMHYTAADTWINDPNGLVYADGVYHLFFQNNPYGTDHENMSWGHAVSPDLIRWRDRPVAILCDENEAIFSGSAVVDHGNTGGFGEPGSAPLVAIYTSHYTDGSPSAGIEAQSLAYSVDGGETWRKYEGNPVLDRGSSDFRDPKVFRYSDPSGEYWVMVAVEAVDRKVVLYRSDNLKDWTYLSEFTSSEPVGKIWECPDLFPLPVDGDSDHMKWVLIVNINLEPGERGSEGLFFVGDFDGVTFTALGGRESVHSGQPEWEPLDHGRDFYATVSFNDAPDGRRVLIGWMSNWEYARTLPTVPWRGAMTLPREASLHTADGRIVLRQRAVAGLAPAGPVRTRGLTDIPAGTHPLGLAWGEEPCLIEATFDVGTSSEFGILLREGGAEATRIAYETERGALVVDRTASGRADLGPAFASKETAPAELVGGRLALQVYVDTSSIEVFAQGGRVTITDLIFPDPSSTGISLHSAGGTAQLISLTLTPLEDAPIERTDGEPPYGEPRDGEPQDGERTDGESQAGERRGRESRRRLSRSRASA